MLYSSTRFLSLAPDSAPQQFYWHSKRRPDSARAVPSLRFSPTSTAPGLSVAHHEPQRRADARSSHSRPKAKTCSRLAGSSSAYESMRSADHAGEPFSLAGYLAARPTLRSLPSGMAVANVRLGKPIGFRAMACPQNTPTGSASSFMGPGHSGHGTRQRHQCLCRGKFRSTAHDRSAGRKRYSYEVTVQKFFRIGRASDEEARTAPTEHPSGREA